MPSINKIINAKIITPHGIIEGDLLIKGGKIEGISEGTVTEETENIYDADGKYVLPGFVDIHTNGSGGFDCTYGKYDESTSKFNSDEKEYFDGLDQAIQSYLKSGCTKVILSTISAPIDQIKKIIGFTKKYKNLNRELNEVIHGFMIEGSFIREKNNAGAHNPEYFQKPSIDLLNYLFDGNEDLIKIINIPPEWKDNSFDPYKYLAEKNVIPAAGHTCATGDETNLAISSGLKLGIHLFNGPSFSSYKPFNRGGTIEALLKSDDMYVEIIADGLHVDKSYFMDALKRKGFDKVIVITDNMFVTGSGVKNEFKMADKVGVVSGNSKYLFIKEKPEALFGSNLTMDEAFENLLNWFTSDIEGVWNKIHPAMSFESALISSVKLCSYNPSALLGISGNSGSIEEGKRADLIIADIKYEEKYKVDIKKVFLNGIIK